MTEINKRFSLICAGALILSIILATCSAKPAAEAKAEVDDARSADIIDNSIASDPNAEFLKSYALKMMSYMNRTVAPCEDFYEYACGNWKNVKRERQADHKRSNLLDIVYTVADAVEQLLMDNTTLAEDLGYGSEMAIAKQFYNACLNAQLHPLPAADPAYLALIKSIGGFPAVEGEAWQASNFSWFNMSAHLTNYGAEGLIHDRILPQFPFFPYFRLPELGFDIIVHSDNMAKNDSNGYKLNEQRMRSYLQANNLTEEQVVSTIDGVFAFWREALEISDRFDEDQMQCLMLSANNVSVPFPKWNDYYDIAWNGDNFSTFEPEHYCDYYYLELDKVCEKHKPAVANYLAMKLLYTMDSKLKDVKYQRDHCILSIENSMRYLLDSLYLRKYFSEETRNEITDIIVQLRKSHMTVLENANWLDEETRQEALSKGSQIEPRIGAFKDKELTEKLIRAINTLTLVPDSFPQNNINLKRLATNLKRYNGLHHKEISNLTKPLELLVSMQVNAFYYNVDNSINVMAGILHPPSYHQAWPSSLKYGTIGYLVGHELTHGFDTEGAKFDANGTERYWWTKKSGEVFKKRATCYVDHFNNYLIPEINRKINGNQTKDENIADSGGLRVAMKAYRSFIKQQQADSENESVNVGRNEQMPGMDLSPEQLFFLGFAQVWCADYKEEHYWDELTNEHTMDKYRVLGAVTHNDDFAQAYSCELGTPMNPSAEKCRIW